MMPSSLSSSPTLSLLLLLSIPPSARAASQSTESIVFPAPHPEAYRSLSLVVSLIGLSVISFCIARRPAGFRVEATLSHRFFAALLIDSWIFIFFSALMTSGIGLSLNSIACTSAAFLCGAFFGLSKVLIYMFLAERVYTVHGGANRLKSTAYRICGLFFLLGLGLLLSLMIWGRVYFLRDGTTHTYPFTRHTMDGTDNACVIGLADPTSISLLVYDLFLNTLFTSLFLYPLYRSKKFTAPLREVARGALWTALVALATSVTQAAIMTALDGQELGWICLGSCDADVTINALALFLFTHLYDQEPIDTVTQPVMCPQSAMPILDTTSEHQQGLISHRSIEFALTKRAGRCATTDEEKAITSEAGTGSRWATSNLSTTVGSVNDGVEKPKYQPNDSYISPTGMVTIEGVIGGEKGKVRKKPSITLADVDGTPDGEETEAQIRSEGRPPQARSGSHSWANSWSGGGRPPSAHPDLEADTRSTDKALFRVVGSNHYDESGAQRSSSLMVVASVRAPTEVYVDPVLEPRFDPDQRQGRNLKRGSVLVEHKGDLETGS